MRIQNNKKHPKIGTLPPLRAGALALLLTTIGFPQLSVADTGASASSRLGASNQGNVATGASGQAVNASSSQAGSGVGTATGQSSGNANAAEGSLRAYASASGNTESLPSFNTSVSASGYGTARWNDYLTIGASGLFGQSGYITAELNLSGSLGGSIFGFTAYGGETGRNETVRMIGTGMSNGGCGGGWNYCASAYSDSHPGLNSFYSDLTPVITLHIPVIFGFQTGLSYTLDVLAGAFVSTRPGENASSVDSFVDYTLSWGGITGVFDSSGNTVLDFTDTSMSGFDYYQQTAAIPEPETYAMLLAGLGLLGVAARRRKLKKAALA